MFGESTVAQVAKNFFGNIWTMLLSVDVPGLDVPFAAFVVAVFLIRFSIRIFGFISGFGFSGADYGRAGNAAEKYKNSRYRSNSRALVVRKNEYDL